MVRSVFAAGIAICALLAGCSPAEVSPAPRADRNAAPQKPPQVPAQAPGLRQTPAGPRGAPPEAPPELLEQWSRFQAALKADDAALLAQVARFPLKSNEFGGDIASPAVLQERYATLFPEKTRSCLLASVPERLEYDGHVLYEVYCDVGPYPIRFLFEPDGRQYFWTGIDNINE